MTVAEATRQYQAMLEAQRRIRAALHGVLSAEDLLQEAAQEVALSRRVLEQAWIDDELARMLS